MLSFDANVLIYAADRDAGERHRVAASLLTRAARFDCVLALQTLGEFFWAVTRKGRLDAGAAATFVEEWQATFIIRAADASRPRMPARPGGRL